MNEFAYADIIILALIAMFIALKLRNTLGKDVGHRPDMDDLRRRIDEQMREDNVIDLPALKEENWSKADEAEEKALVEKINDDRVNKALDEIKAIDKQFRAKEFLEGAKVAFEWVMNAFNKGEKDQLKQLMAKDVYAEFEKAIDDRPLSGAKMESTLVSVKSTDIVEAALKQKKAHVTVKFVTEQIIVERGHDGEIVSGDASNIQVIEDEWVFERDLASGNPNWTIIDT